MTSFGADHQHQPADHDRHPLAADLLTEDALRFVTDLQRRFGPQQLQLVDERRQRHNRIRSGERLTFGVETEPVRRGRWSISPPPKDLEDRRVEVTGSPSPDVMIAALNSGARVVTADFEDACSPTWTNILTGHVAVRDFHRGELTSSGGQTVLAVDHPVALVVGVRGWHQAEPHFRVDGEAGSASLFDFGLCTFHCARTALDGGTGPYFSLPKMEGHLEARLWADVIGHTEQVLGLDRGSVRVTVVIETILAAFEMDEILYELRDHACGLGAGRCDYLFSLAKTFQHDPDYVLPDRSDIRMEAPFMRAFGELLVSTCHRRGAHAIGGVTPAVPSATDPDAAASALEQITADKWREAGDGFDGSVVAHPAAVPVARAEFDRTLGERPNQLGLQRDDVYITAGDLLAVRSTAGAITEAGVRASIRTGLGYLSARHAGHGTTTVEGVLVDRSAAELARSQLWQWVHHEAALSNGQVLTPEITSTMIDDETDAIRPEEGDDLIVARRDAARRELQRLTLSDCFSDYLTLADPARL